MSNNYESVKRWREKNRKICSICSSSISYRATTCQGCARNRTNWSLITLNDQKEKRKYQTSSRIRQLARNIYAKSGKPKFCIRCKYQKHYEVCHIKPINSYDLTASVKEINNIDNLIALCPNCHWEFDKGLFKVPLEGVEPT